MMDLIRRKPFGEMSSIRREMENLWNRFYDDPLLPKVMAREWLPSVDVLESEDKLLISVELPGVEAKDVSISISGDLLTIKGEKKGEEERKDDHCYCSVRYYGSFQRSIRLPINTKTDEVDATFEKGTLHVTLQKTEEAKKKEIEIKETHISKVFLTGDYVYKVKRRLNYHFLITHPLLNASFTASRKHY